VTVPNILEDSADRLRRALPEGLRPFIRIDSVALPPAMLEIVATGLAEAGRRLAAVLTLDRTCNVVFGKPPFDVKLSNGRLMFSPFDHVVLARVNSVIFVDTERLITYEPKLQVAGILEEFVHVLMNVEDETLVMTVVAALYPEIAVVDGRYVATDR
jgi:hypothetical protein